jgi:hypothetical protein
MFGFGSHEAWAASTKQLVFRHIFDESTPMPNDELGLSKMMIASLVCSWYTAEKFQPDTDFMTHPRDWVQAKPDGFQKSGYCIVSNYPIPRVWIYLELSEDEKYILRAYHAQGVPE